MYLYDIMEFLGMPEYRLLGGRETNEVVDLSIETHCEGLHCKVCGDWAWTLYDHQPVRTIRTETVRDRAVNLLIRPKRFRCGVCGCITQERLPHVAPYARQTHDFAQKLQNRALRHSATIVAEEEHVKYATVRARLAEGIETWEQPAVDWSQVRRIGIDEFANKKRHRYYLIIVDLDTHKVLGVLSQRSKLYLKAWLLQLRELTTIEAFSQDMWAPYGQAVQKVFPDAVQVIDQFHVIKHVIDALIKVRRGLQKSLSKAERKPIWESRHLLCKNRETLSDEQQKQLDALLESHPRLKTAYWLKEHFRNWYRFAGTRAEEGIRLWFRRVQRAGLKPFLEVVKTIKRWQDSILNFFRQGITNGAVEGLNNRVKAIKRMCYGRLSYRNLRARILFNCQGRLSPG